MRKYAPLIVPVLLLAVTSIPRAQTVIWSTLFKNNEQAALSDTGQRLVTEAADDFYINVPRFEITTVKFHQLTYGTDASPDFVGFTLNLFQSYPLDSDTSRTPASLRDGGPADAPLESVSWSGSAVKALSLGDFTVDNTVIGGAKARFGVEAPGITGQLWEITLELPRPILISCPDPNVAGSNHYWLSITSEASDADCYWLAGSNPPSVYPGSDDREACLRTGYYSPDWRMLSDIIDGQNNATYNNLSFEIVGKVVPEPSALLALMCGFAGVGGKMLRKRTLP